jgi:uncharacterized protein (DUF4415 family)
MKKNASDIVKHSFDPNNPPELTATQKARLETLAAMPDSQIDYSDAPFRPDAVWTKAVELPDTKHQITLRIDADVLNYFRHTGTRYQTRINAVLRSYVKAQQHAN